MVTSRQKIEGDRDLSGFEIASINDCKSIAVEVGTLCDIVGSMPGVDQRWLAIARTDLQKGFMALVRSITKPETF